MQTGRVFLIASVFAILALGLSCSGGFPPEFPAPDFTLKSPLSGEEINLSALRGKPVVVYWFTSW